MDESIFLSRLVSGEHILWTGKAGRGILLTSRDVFLIPFSILWCGFAIFWTSTASSMGNAPAFFPLFGLLFVFVGLYFVFGRFLFDAWVRRGLNYAVTDRRILILRASPMESFTTINLDHLPELELKEKGDGSGTIRFGRRVSVWSNHGISSWTPSLDPTPQFLAVENVRHVFDLIQKASERDR
ncbi:MAG: PH domain-containing protein [Parvibaculum sp.]|uniref:PH domain-containing protein n=1 Tax=Parvibaculum sp. TaxID=2024848 RepID=UPI00283ED34D|nr:PH domain-containing protein [Parvibaculum sp.]MDR3499036.1 PH domain-containing protein [Parvibaculum sp.]